jgi:hypothetical protein
MKCKFINTILLLPSIPLMWNTELPPICKSCLALYYPNFLFYSNFRKCIEGLDYYVAEGGRSFQELEEIIQKLKIDDETKKSFTSRLLTGKRYLKSEYKVILLF